MDVILEILRRLTVKGGVGKILEYGGPGVKDLSVTESGNDHEYGRGTRRNNLNIPER